MCPSFKRWSFCSGLCLAGLLAFTAGCIKVVRTGTASGPPIRLAPRLTVQFSGTGRLNDCGRGTAFPLEIRIAQLKGRPELRGVSAKQLWADPDGDVLRDLLIPETPAKTITLEPGRSAPAAEDLSPDMRVVLIYGSFCRADPDSYYVVVERHEQAGLTLQVIADRSGLRIVK
jgi:type VI secretion system VasD/TssJ family lipoprotein